MKMSVRNSAAHVACGAQINARSFPIIIRNIRHNRNDEHGQQIHRMSHVVCGFPHISIVTRTTMSNPFMADFVDRLISSSMPN